MAGSQDISIVFWLGTCAMVAFILALVVMVLAYQRHFFKVKRREATLLLETAFASELKERQRIANDLHDGLQSDLSAVRMQLFRYKKQSDPKVLEDIDEAIVAAIESTRQISRNLIPPFLAERGLSYAIKAHCEKLSDDSEIVFSVNAATELGLQTLEAYTLYRVLQEFTSNIIKYGDARNCSITITETTGALQLIVVDDGRKYDFEMAYREGQGMGLKNIKSRLETIGATLQQEDTEKGNRFAIHLKLAA